MSNPRLAPQTEPAVLELLDTAASLQHRLDRALSASRGVTFSEYRLLLALAGAPPAGLPRIELARMVRLTPSAVTRALKPLEKLGFLTTERNARDARQSLAMLSSAGKELLSDARGILRDLLLDSPLNRLSETQVAEFRARLSELNRR